MELAMPAGFRAVDKANHRAREQTVKKATRVGFTVIELLIVIGIIALLAAMVGYAVTGISTRSKITATKLEMQNFRSMISEFKTVTRGLTRQPAYMWVNHQQYTPTALIPIDIWRDADPTDGA